MVIVDGILVFAHGNLVFLRGILVFDDGNRYNLCCVQNCILPYIVGTSEYGCMASLTCRYII
jgi:hypothetical protein